LCCKVYISYKTQCSEGWLCLGFDNAFTCAQYSQMLSPFTICMPSIAVFSGGYNLRVRKFPLAFTIFLHPFFQCSLILIFEFFYFFFSFLTKK
jgi:hypothetical protein